MIVLSKPAGVDVGGGKIVRNIDVKAELKIFNAIQRRWFVMPWDLRGSLASFRDKTDANILLTQRMAALYTCATEMEANTILNGN